MGYPWVGLGLAPACSHIAFSLSSLGVSMGNACPLMLFPTAASARKGTRGPCATRLGHLQTLVGSCSACMATARPQPPRGCTVCATPAFRASCVSKVRGHPPDMPPLWSLPTTWFSELTFLPPNLSHPSASPPCFCTSGYCWALVPQCLGSEPHRQMPPISLAQLAAP